MHFTSKEIKTNSHKPRQMRFQATVSAHGTGLKGHLGSEQCLEVGLVYIWCKSLSLRLISDLPEAYDCDGRRSFSPQPPGGASRARARLQDMRISWRHLKMKMKMKVCFGETNEGFTNSLRVCTWVSFQK